MFTWKPSEKSFKNRLCSRKSRLTSWYVNQYGVILRFFGACVGLFGNYYACGLFFFFGQSCASVKEGQPLLN